MFVTVQAVSSSSIRTVKTNSISLERESTAALVARISAAALRIDLISVTCLSTVIFECIDLSIEQAGSVISSIDSVSRATSAGPSSLLSTLVIRLLHLALAWCVQQRPSGGFVEPLSVASRLVLWLSTPSGLGASPLSDLELWSASVVANNLEILAGTTYNSSLGLARTAADQLRVIAMHGRLRAWTIGQQPVQLHGGTGFLSTLSDLNGVSLSFNSDSNHPVYSQPDVVLMLPAELPRGLAGKDELASVSAWVISERLYQQMTEMIIVISPTFTIDIAPFVGYGHNPSLEVTPVSFTNSILFSLRFNGSELSKDDQDRAAAGQGISCVMWSIDQLSGSGIWNDSACAVESIQIDPSSDTLKGVTGLVLCSCSDFGTFAVTYTSSSANTDPSAEFFGVQWSESTPSDGDELVIGAGRTLTIAVVALSKSKVPWYLTSKGYRTAPCTVTFNVGGEPFEALTVNGSAKLSDAVVSEVSNGPLFAQTTTWNFTLSAAWTLTRAETAEGHSDVNIKAELLEDPSGGSLRQWNLRILDCETLVQTGDTLDAIAARYGTSARILFAINPMLSSPGMLPAPLSGIFPASSWDCGSENGRPCTPTSLALRGAGGTRLRIGRLVHVPTNVSLADAVAQFGGSLRHIADQNPSRVTVLSQSPLVLRVESAQDVCVILRDGAYC